MCGERGRERERKGREEERREDLRGVVEREVGVGGIKRMEGRESV